MNTLSDYSIDWQHLVVLLYALEGMSGDIPTRQRTMEHIQTEQLLELRPEDHLPYRTAQEPSWQTDIAWARKNAVMLGFVNNHEWNSWEVARSGREFLKNILGRCKTKNLLLSRCCLWSLRLKQIVSPGFTPSSTDSVAPPKGNRSMPSLVEYQQLIEEKLRTATIEELATRISRKLGMNIPPTKPSVAYALHVYVMSTI